MLESKDEAEARSLMLFWALATSPYFGSSNLSQGRIAGERLCNMDEWTAVQCSEAKKQVTAAATAAGY